MFEQPESSLFDSEPKHIPHVWMFKAFSCDPSLCPLEGAAAKCRRLREQQLHVTNSIDGLRTWFRMV